MVRSWGDNTYGQLGDGTNNSTAPLPGSTPTQAGDLRGVTAVAAGLVHSLARSSGGAVWAWGQNSSGQLGDGTTTDRWSPVQVPGLNASAIAAGGGGSCTPYDYVCGDPVNSVDLDPVEKIRQRHIWCCRAERVIPGHASCFR